MRCTVDVLCSAFIAAQLGSSYLAPFPRVLLIGLLASVLDGRLSCRAGVRVDRLRGSFRALAARGAHDPRALVMRWAR